MQGVLLIRPTLLSSIVRAYIQEEEATYGPAAELRTTQVTALKADLTAATWPNAISVLVVSCLCSCNST